MKRGEIWWAELGAPRGSEPGYRRPVLIVQADPFTLSRIGTIVVVAITSDVGRGAAPGNVVLKKSESRLSKESIANVSQILTLDRRFLVKRVGSLPGRRMNDVDAGLRMILGLASDS